MDSQTDRLSAKEESNKKTMLIYSLPDIPLLKLKILHHFVSSIKLREAGAYVIIEVHKLGYWRILLSLLVA